MQGHFQNRHLSNVIACFCKTAEYGSQAFCGQQPAGAGLLTCVPLAKELLAAD